MQHFKMLSLAIQSRFQKQTMIINTPMKTYSLYQCFFKVANNATKLKQFSLTDPKHSIPASSPSTHVHSKFDTKKPKHCTFLVVTSSNLSQITVVISFHFQIENFAFSL